MSNYEYEYVFLTEKDSQVQALSVVLNAQYTQKWKPAYGVLKNNTKVAIVPLKGHVLESLTPQEYSDAYKDFGEGGIYVFPPEYKLKPVEREKHILDQAVFHLKKAKKIIIASDTDNEGTALAMNVIRYANCENKIERMLPMGSTHPKELLKALREPIKIPYLLMSDAGRARAFIDWAEGMSLSRALSFYLGNRYNVKLNFGGVKTPLIYLVVERDLNFEAHKSSYYWEATFDLSCNGYLFKGKLKQEIINQKEKKELSPSFDSEMEIEEAIKKLKESQLIIDKFTSKQGKESPPKLYELSALQVDMFKQNKVNPENTTSIAQKLYDYPISIQTYPRTDVPYLKEAEYEDVIPILNKLNNTNLFPKEIIDNILAKSPPKRKSTFNNAEVVAHGAIVPTLSGDYNQYLPTLTELEKNEFYLVAKRYILNFMEDYIFQKNSGQTEMVENLVITFEEKAPLQAGFRELNEPGFLDRMQAFAPTIPATLKKGDSITISNVKIEKKETKPKPRFTMDTLLQAMKKVATLFPDDPDIKEYLGESGIGTIATRATIIKQVMSEEFNKGKPWLVEEKGNIVATKKARDFIACLPKELVSPIKRAMFSKKLNEVVKGTLPAKGVIDEYRDDVKNNIEIIKKAYNENGAIAGSERKGFDQKVVGKCPICNNDIVVGKKAFFCKGANLVKGEDGKYTNSGCKYVIFMTSLEKLGKKNISEKEVEELLRKGRCRVNLKSQKTGKAYSKEMVVCKKYGVKVVFTK